MDIEINGEPVDIQMKLDDTGTAFFVEEVDEEEDCWQDNLQTSPIPGHTGPQGSKTEGENPCLNQFLTQSEHEHLKDVFMKAHCEKDLEKKHKIEQIEHLDNCNDEMFDMDDISEAEVANDWLENSKLYKGDSNNNPLFTRGSFVSSKDQSLENLSIVQHRNPTEKVLHESFQPKSVCSGFHYFPSQQPSSFGQQLKQSEDKNVWRWGELPNTDPLIDDEINMEIIQSEERKPNEKSLPKNCSGIQAKHAVGFESEDIANQQDIKKEFVAINHNEQSSVVERTDSGCEEEIDSSSRSNISNLLSKHIPDLAASLCGGLSEGEISPEQFQLKILEFPEFQSRINTGTLLSDSSLVFRVNGKYLTWEKAAPILFSIILFQKSLPTEVVRNIAQVQESTVVPPSLRETNGSTPRTHEDSSTCFRKSLRLSSEKLLQLRLKSGKNEMELSVTTALQGTSRCRCNIYLWHHQDKVKHPAPSIPFCNISFRLSYQILMVPLLSQMFLATFSL